MICSTINGGFDRLQFPICSAHSITCKKPYSTHFQKIRTKIQGPVHNIITILHVLTKYAINAKSNKVALKANHITVCESGRYRGPTNSPDNMNMGMYTPYITEPTKNLDAINCQSSVANAEAKPTVVMITMLGKSIFNRP